MITAEQIEKIRKSGLVAIAGVSVSDILDSLDACETERDRLRTEVARLREIALSDDVRGMLSAHGSDGTILVVGEFSSGREFCEKFRLSAQVAEVPELTDAILDLACGPDISGKADMHSAAFRDLSRLQYRRGWEDLAARLVPTHPKPAPNLVDEVDRILSGVKRYAFDATKGEYFEIAHGAFMKVDHVAKAIYKRYTPPQADAVVVPRPLSKAPTDRPILAFWQSGLGTISDVVHYFDEEGRFVCWCEMLEYEDNGGNLDFVPRDAQWIELPDALRTSAQAHNGEESK